MRPSTSKINFNSIKVRLKLTCVGNNDLMDVFQFHKGTSKTRLLIGYNCFRCNFSTHELPAKAIREHTIVL